MSKVNTLPKDLPQTTLDFTLDVQGEITNIRYVGDFSCKVMNAKDRAFAAKHKAFLNNGMESVLDVGTLDLHEKLAYLRYALTESPKFWKESDLGYELYDINVITEIYNKVLEFEESWMTDIWGKEYVQNLKEGTDGAKS